MRQLQFVTGEGSEVGHLTDRQADCQTDLLADCQTDTQAYKRTAKRTDRPTGRLTNGQTDLQADCQTDRQTRRRTAKYIDRQTETNDSNSFLPGFVSTTNSHTATTAGDSDQETHVTIQ